ARWSCSGRLPRPVGASGGGIHDAIPLTAGAGAETLNAHPLPRPATMTDPPSLTDLMTRLRSGDADAADEFMLRYGPALRVAVRTRLTDPALRRHFDSEDVCQSVMASFFARAACGQLAPDDPA